MKKRPLKLLLSLTLLFSIVCLAVFLIRREGLSAAGDAGMTVKELLKSGKTKLGQWYWVDLGPINITMDVLNKERPLYEGGKALLTVPGKVEKPGRKSVPWNAVMFEEVRTSRGKRIVLARKICVLHIVREPDREAEQAVYDSIQEEYGPLEAREDGIYYFGHTNGKARELSAEDVAFMRVYHRLQVSSGPEGRTRKIDTIAASVGRLILYDYGPNGLVRRFTSIQPDDAFGEPKRYFVEELTFTGNMDITLLPVSPKGEISAKTWRVQDTADRYWLNNMLHE